MVRDNDVHATIRDVPTFLCDREAARAYRLLPMDHENALVYRVVSHEELPGDRDVGFVTIYDVMNVL